METPLVEVVNGDTELKILNEQERADLLACEETIGRGLQSFVEVGLAMLTIREKRLYRQEYRDFQGYCEHRWGIGRIHAHRCIDAAKVCKMLPIGNKPANEAQVRPLTRIRTEDGELDRKGITRVWRRVVDSAPTDDAGRKVLTARDVEEAAKPVLRRRGLRVASGYRLSRRPSASAKGGANDTAGTAVAGDKAITNEEFVALHAHVKKLAKMMITETIPESVRLVIEDVCNIVLGDPA